jgi:hypothetical protein
MTKYEDLDLPSLSAPWFWEKGKMDGDPMAVRIEGGWRTSVYEANACKYTDELRVEHKRVTEGEGRSWPRGIPFPVFAAVHQALRQWYGVK